MALAVLKSFQVSLSHESHLRRFCRYPDTQHKILKAADPLLDAIGEIAKITHASKATLKTISRFRDYTKSLNNIFTGIYIFTSLIPALIFALTLCWRLAKGIISHKSVKLNPFKSSGSLEFNEIAKTRLEKSLMLACVCAKTIRAASSTSAFLLHPFTERRIPRQLTIVKHAFGVISSTLEIGFEYVAFQRAAKEGNCLIRCKKVFEIKTLEISVGLVESSLRLFYELAKLIKTLPPTWLRLPITLVIASLGLYKIWLKTA